MGKAQIQVASRIPLPISVYLMGIPKVSPFLTRRGLFIFIPTRYSALMNELWKPTFNVTGKRGLMLILTQDSARKSKTELIASLILRGPLFIVSGDEWLPGFALPRILRAHTTAIKEVLGRLYTVRASTCYRLF